MIKLDTQRKRFLTILLLCLSLVRFAAAKTIEGEVCHKIDIDSLISSCINYNSSYDSITAEVYLRGKMNVQKRNIFLRLMQHFVPVGSKPDDGSFESVGRVMRFSSYYYYMPEAFNGDFNLYANRLPEYLFVNAYASRFTSFEFVAPFSPDAFKYYTFALKDAHGATDFSITFTPKKKNKRLLNGEIEFSADQLTIKRIKMQGQTSFTQFDMIFYFSDQLEKMFLPNKVLLQMKHRVLGNKVSQEIEVAMDYSKIVPSSDVEKKKVNLGRINYLKFTSDSINLISDTSFWNRKRQLGKLQAPVTEDTIYAHKDHQLQKETAEEDENTYLEVTKKIILPKNWKNKHTQLHYAGIISPSIFGYSGVNGFRYRQQIKLSHLFRNGDVLSIQPGIEYQSKHRKLLYRLNTSYKYSPEHLGEFGIHIVKDNDLYEFPDPKDPGLRLNFSYNYYELSNQIELINGLLLKNRIKYREWKKGEYRACDLIPEISLSYTPRQYYWINGKQKEYLYSPWPTFSMTLAYAIPGLMELSSEYWQLEVETLQHIRSGLSRTFSYYVGLGKIWHKGYFRPSDFRGFNVRYPSGNWQQHYGSLFNNLDHDFYRVPHEYIQTQLRLDGELLFLSLMDLSIQKYIFSEHLTLSHLYTKGKSYYSEIGYGMSNDLLGLGIVLGFDKYKYDSFGLKLQIKFIAK